MKDASSLLPITALVAVVLFVAKEVVETARRWRAEVRRKVAFRTLLARECELNHWAIRSLRHIAQEITQLPNAPPPEAFVIEYAKSGRIYACIDTDAEANYMKIAVPEVHKEQMERHLLDIATLDQSLLILVEPALSAAAELEHLRESLMYHGSAEEGDQARDVAADFGDYALRELDTAYEAIAALYFGCTKRSLTEVRLR